MKDGRTKLPGHSVKLRTAVVMHKYEEMDYAQMAKILRTTLTFKAVMGGATDRQKQR